MTLRDLTGSIPDARLHGDDGVIARDIAYDSRSVTPGALFFCVPGKHSDGHAFAPDVVDAGAVALVVERILDVPVPQIVVPSVRRAMGPISSRFFGDPSRAMALVGVTGTNGKTTTTFMIEAAARALGRGAGLIGTVETHIGSEVLPVTRTTPEAPDLQRLLARMRDEGVSIAAMEASSEGLVSGRVDGTHFAAALFTNLSQDHLNTHGTMEAYFEAKASLFEPRFADAAIVNADDAWGRRLIELTTLPVTTFSLDATADVRASNIEMGAAGSRFDAIVGRTRIAMHVRIPGRYNVANALGVVAAASVLGWPLDDVARGIAELRGVPGRMEPVEAGQDFTVLVDYAHTPDSLENVLRAAREITPPGARLVAVFGCGGDRDRSKRPLMGRAGAELADRCVITSDNPRTEDPASIVAMVAEGARAAGKPFDTIIDRREAIAAALGGASPGDVIVIAGKGHEPYQEFADHTIHFDDREVAREVLEEICSR